MFQAARAGDASWPASLANLAAAPKQLHYSGDIGILARPCVSIVGSRRPTQYGERIARELASAFASAGACVVSGMAFGIDAAAHIAALASGATAAVLGAGIDVVYPAAHRELYANIASDGVVLSEFPEGTQPFRGCFPRRNRIIAALSRLTIVVEAGATSGALLTAGYAVDYDRVVAAVPGPIDSPQSEGSNRLLRDGAHVVTCIEDALALLNLTGSNTSPQPDLTLGSDEASVWDLITNGINSTDAIVASAGWTPPRCLVALTNLEIQGLITCSPAGEVFRR